MEKITLEQRFARALMIAAAGGAVALAMMTQERALHGEWSIVRCACAGAFLAGFILARGFGGRGAWLWFRAGFFFSLATVMGFIMGVCLIPFDEMMTEHDLWQYLGLTAVSPFAGLKMIADALPPGAVTGLTWLAGLGAAGAVARRQGTA